ncbi:MAG TPA: hypothetical protein PKZ49_09190 [Nitrosomonas sp.]|nr:hypothetical protein [Nitrosomonas sp.]
MIQAISAILTGLSNIKYLADLVKQIVEAAMLWYIDNMNAETSKLLADAAAASATAKTDQEHADASALWKKALSRPRIIK